jgi:hypothetical protein
VKTVKTLNIPHVSRIPRGAIISVSPKTEGAYISNPEIKCTNRDATSRISCHDYKGMAALELPSL